MTGRRVHEIQSYSNCRLSLQKDWPSYGQALAEQGVHSAYTGKTHVYNECVNLGFSELIDVRDHAGKMDKAPYVRHPLAIQTESHERANGWGVDERGLRGDADVVDGAVRWLNEKAPFLDKPWTLTVNIINPHFWHVVTQELWDMYADAAAAPAFGKECESAMHPYACDLRDHFQADQFSDENIAGLIRGYLGCVTFVDQQIGRLVDALKSAGLFEDTDVIYTSDHGEMLGKFGMWWKCTLYEDSVRVPLVAAGPSFPKGVRVRTPVDLLDVQATLFACTGAERPADWVGEPLTQIAPNDEERVVFSEYHGHGTRASAYMIRRGKWKYIHYVEAPNQLFDLDADPDELTNLLDKHPNIAAELESELRAICSPEEENRRVEAFIKTQLDEARAHENTQA